MGSGADLLNPHMSRISKLIPVCLTNNRRRSDHISEPHAKFGEHRRRIVDVIPNQIQIRNLRISKIWFLFPVSLSIEYKVGTGEFYLYMGFAADLLKMWSPETENCKNRNPHIKHNCVLSKSGLSNALTETGICTSLNVISIYGFIHHWIQTGHCWILSAYEIWCWYVEKMCSPEPKKCQNPNPHTSKISKLLPVCVTNRRLMRPHSWAACKIWWKVVQNCGRNT